MAETRENDSKYVVDASAWISIEGHPGQNLILFCISKLIEQDRITCPPEAWEEVQKCPWVHAWLDQYKDQIVSAPRAVDYLMTVGEVTHAFPGMASPRGRKEKADQYVVGVALFLNRTSNPTRHVVIAGESLAKRPNRKIPRACQHFGVECCGLMEMLAREFPDEKW